MKHTPIHVAAMLTPVMPSRALAVAAMAAHAMPAPKPQASGVVTEEQGADWFARRPDESRQVWRARTRAAR